MASDLKIIPVYDIFMKYNYIVPIYQRNYAWEEKQIDQLIEDIEETIDHNKELRSEIEKLSFLKALKVYKDNPDAVVIGADTIVVVDNKVLGKPKNEQEANEMLHKLQNNKHTVITGCTIISSKMSETFSNMSDVYFNPMSDEEIDEYIKTNEPMDKAGAYAIQGIGSKFIHSIDGDYYSIMGFPISEVYQRIKKYL